MSNDAPSQTPPIPAMPKLLDNVTSLVRDDLKETITPKSKIRIAAACFSIYAYEELKKNLEGIEELRFIFTSPAFTAEKAEKSRREFYIPRLTREKSLYGTHGTRGASDSIRLAFRYRQLSSAYRHQSDE